MNVPIRYHITGRRASEIAESIERGIREGDLTAGTRLPTVRSLASHRGISTATVASAYRELRRRGLVAGAGRLGTSIAPRVPPSPRGKPIVPAGVRDLLTGNPDPALLPDLGPALAALPHEPVLYGAAGSDPELIELAAARLEADGVSAEHLTVVGGALDGVQLALMAHLTPGDRIAVEDPCYPGIIDLAAALGLAVIPMAIDDRGPTPESLARALRSGAAACSLTPRAQNPYGSAIDAERAEDLRAVLNSHPAVLVIEDDHAFDITERPCHTLCEPGRARWVHLRSVSKSLGPDLRLAILAGDATTVARVEGRRLLAAGWVSHLLQRLVVALWRDPEAEARAAHVAQTYTRRRDAMQQALQSRGIESHGRSGLNVWIPVAHEDATVALLQESGWGVLAGDRFRIASARGIRVTTARLEPEDAIHFAADLETALTPRPSRLS
ncbi:MAG TPA: aminotransferase class I/II-fold pyridoxal phosphate-dependent enzyme [Candidatus Dormibacteraeota bacterium]